MSEYINKTIAETKHLDSLTRKNRYELAQARKSAQSHTKRWKTSVFWITLISIASSIALLSIQGYEFLDAKKQYEKYQLDAKLLSLVQEITGLLGKDKDTITPADKIKAGFYFSLLEQYGESAVPILMRGIEMEGNSHMYILALKKATNGNSHLRHKVRKESLSILNGVFDEAICTKKDINEKETASNCENDRFEAKEEIFNEHSMIVRCLTKEDDMDSVIRFGDEKVANMYLNDLIKKYEEHKDKKHHSKDGDKDALPPVVKANTKSHLVTAGKDDNARDAYCNSLKI